jgi:hypothetical protein
MLPTTMIPSDDDLRARLVDFEDSFVERKSSTDKGGWLRSVVAFANTAPVNYPAVLFIGADNDGKIPSDVDDNTCKSFSDFILKHVYPTVYTCPHFLTVGGKTCLAVIVPGSPNRPHFAGKAFIRDGTQTREASEEQYEKLIDQRSDKVYEILRWVGKSVRIENVQLTGGNAIRSGGAVSLKGCNRFYVTVQSASNPGDPPRSYSLDRISLSFDHADQVLILEVYDVR